LILREMKEEGRFNEVIRQCLKALDVYPEDIRLRSLLGECLLETGFIGQAELELNRVTLEINRVVSAYKLLGKIYLQQRRSDEAAEMLKQYLVHNPTDEEALELLDRVQTLEELWQVLENGYKLGYHKALRIMKLSSTVDIWAVTGLDDETVRRSKMRPYHGIQEALDDAVKMIRSRGESPRIIIIPSGGMTIPHITDGRDP
jgi:tetratricopeptide (TPR) repeat protein